MGYSYGNGGDIQLDDEADGNDVHWFLRNFLYPDTCNNPPCGYNEFAANEFYMTGESCTCTSNPLESRGCFVDVVSGNPAAPLHGDEHSQRKSSPHAGSCHAHF